MKCSLCGKKHSTKNDRIICEKLDTSLLQKYIENYSIENEVQDWKELKGKYQKSIA